MELVNEKKEVIEEVTIQVNDLTVRYRIPDEKISGAKEYLEKALTHKLKHREFVALKNLNMTIKKGERVGIIGHNGAGKSTLLKVIAHVIKPSEGTIKVSGSIAPLLELGAGFDLELTGVENIYLNGSILGRSKRYLDAVKEDIINFTELGEFINYPVKNYSSGMRAKLGFAIATQVDADILLVDEVFGVGDENFKRKSKAKMVEMINSGKTVVIVSHDMTQIVDLTDRVIWMNNGEIFEEGDPQEICDRYCAYMLEHQNIVVEKREARPLKKDVDKGKKRKENNAEVVSQGVLSKLAQKTGLLNKMLNDPVVIDELIHDRRILRRIQAENEIVEKLIASGNALDLVIRNDDILYEILQNEIVKKKITDNPFLLVKPEEPINRIWGKVDDCIYYKEDKLLYVKGWYMPVDAYTDIKIAINGSIIETAQRHLNRTGANKGSDNPLNRFSGWEFIKEIPKECDELEVLVSYNDRVLVKNVVEVKRKEEKSPKKIEWKCGHRYFEEDCWELYQKYVMCGFNLISFQTRVKYNNLLEEDERAGWLYKKNFRSDEKELGFRLEINNLGLRGPADSTAQNVVIGNGCGLGFGVDEDKAWYADKTFEKNWINLSYACEPNQMKCLIKNNLKYTGRTRSAIMLYEASFWNIGISERIRVNESMLHLKMNESFIKEKESFYDFYNKLYEGIFTIGGNAGDSLINYKYAQFDFEKNREKCQELLHKWHSILGGFSKVIVLRIPNKEYVSAGEVDNELLHLLKKNQDVGWNLFKESMQEIKSIEFVEPYNFCVSDYFKGTGFLNNSGNEKLRNWIKKSSK